MQLLFHFQKQHYDGIGHVRERIMREYLATIQVVMQIFTMMLNVEQQHEQDMHLNQQATCVHLVLYQLW